MLPRLLFEPYVDQNDNVELVLKGYHWPGLMVLYHVVLC